MNKLLPNRVALYLTAAAALLGALAPIVADLDIESVAGIAAGLTALSAIVYKWLDGWSKWERGVGDLGVVAVDEEPPDEFDEATAEPIPAAAVEAAKAPEGSTPPPPTRKS